MGALVDHSERIFHLRLREEASALNSEQLPSTVIVGELWQGDGRVPVAGLIAYRGRVDSVITFFVDQFIYDPLFQPGDSLLLSGEDDATATVLLARKKGSA